MSEQIENLFDGDFAADDAGREPDKFDAPEEAEAHSAEAHISSLIFATDGPPQVESEDRAADIAAGHRPASDSKADVDAWNERKSLKANAEHDRIEREQGREWVEQTGQDPEDFPQFKEPEPPKPPQGPFDHNKLYEASKQPGGIDALSDEEFDALRSEVAEHGGIAPHDDRSASQKLVAQYLDRDADFQAQNAQLAAEDISGLSAEEIRTEYGGQITQAETARQQAVETGMEALRADQAEFKTATPDFEAAREFAKAERIKQLKQFQPSASKAQLEAYVSDEEKILSDRIFRTGASPAAAVYRYAENHGYVSKGNKGLRDAIVNKSTVEMNAAELSEKTRLLKSLQGVSDIDDMNDLQFQRHKNALVNNDDPLRA